ncbi:MAG: crossover junction endodeoxyribonuclease RuvC [bacterium]
MIILAIDPGYERLGIAVVEKTHTKKETVLFSECFRTSSKLDFYERLLLIGDRVLEIIKNYSPSSLSIENLFISNNQKTAMRVSEVRGSIIFLAKKQGLTIYEMTPLQIKSAVTGNGKSSKVEMIKMVGLLTKNSLKTLKSQPLLDDEFDAIAIGLAYFAYNKLPI